MSPRDWFWAAMTAAILFAVGYTVGRVEGDYREMAAIKKAKGVPCACCDNCPCDPCECGKKFRPCVGGCTCVAKEK